MCVCVCVCARNISQDYIVLVTYKACDDDFILQLDAFTELSLLKNNL